MLYIVFETGLINADACSTYQGISNFWQQLFPKVQQLFRAITASKPVCLGDSQYNSFSITSSFKEVENDKIDD